MTNGWRLEIAEDALTGYLVNIVAQELSVYESF